MADNYCKCCGDGTPEYIIELNQQGAPGKRGEKGDEGYSPVIDFIADNDEIRFSSTNENNITYTPNLYDYLAKKDLSNVDNLYDLVLKRDGSNATKNFTLNKINFITNDGISQRIYSLGGTGLKLSGNPLRLDGEASGSTGYPNRIIISEFGSDITLGNTNKANIIINNDMATYNGNELATVNNISDSKITISQGNVVKGSFTLNQSGDTTIELDTGITNPLKIEGATEDNPSGGTITYGMELGLDSSNKVYLDYTRKFSGGGGTAIISENIIKDNKVVGLTAVENSITEVTTLANNTEASLNQLKTDYESNKTKVAEELTTLGNQINNKQDTLIAGNNITIVDNVINATGGTGDVTAAGNNRFTGDNTFIGKVNIAGGALTVDGLANINQATVQYLNAVNITSSGEINATSIKANGLRSDDIQTTENKKYLTEVDVDNQTIQIVEGKLHANLPDLSDYVPLTTYNELLARVEALEAEINGGNA